MKQVSEAGTRGSPRQKMWGVHTGRLAESGYRPEATPCAYRKQRGTGQVLCGKAHGVSRARSYPGALYASPLQVPRASGHPARADCGSSACLVSGVLFWPRVSCAGSAHCVSGALGLFRSSMSSTVARSV